MHTRYRLMLIIFFFLIGKTSFAQEPRLMLPIGHTSRLVSARFSFDDKKVVTSSDDGTVKIWDALSGMLLGDLKGHRKKVNFAEFSPDNKKIVTASADNTAKIWDVASGLSLADLAGHTGSVSFAEFSSDNKKIVTASTDSTAKVWDMASGRLLITIRGHKGRVNSAVFSPDGKKIVTVSSDSTVKVWSAESGQPLLTVSGYPGNLNKAEFLENGTRIIIIYGGFNAEIRDVASGEWLRSVKLKWGYDVDYSSDGKKILVRNRNTAKILDSLGRQLLMSFEGRGDWIYSAQFTADGKKIVTASMKITRSFPENKVQLWDAGSGKLVHTFRIPDLLYEIRYAQFSPDEKQIATVSVLDSAARIWDADSGSLLVNLKGHNGTVNSVQFSFDGKKIVTASDDSTAKIWDPVSGLLLLTLKGHKGAVNSATFFPDGKKIKTIADDKKIKIWDAASGLLLSTYETDQLSLSEFSVFGKKIVTIAGSDAVIRDSSSGLILANLKGHTNTIKSVQFSPDGKKVITSSLDNTCKFWNAENGELLYTFFPVNREDYLVVDKFNRYDGTEAARKLLYFTCGTEIVELDQVKDQLWVPNLASRIIKGDSINSKKLSQLDLCGLTPLVENIEDTNGFRFSIIPRRGGLGESVLFVNGIETKRFRPDQLSKTANGYQLYIDKDSLSEYFIAGDINPVSLKAYTGMNDISSRGIVINHKDERKASGNPNVYIVSIGVSDYKGDEFDLKFADKDASDISHAIGLAASKYLNSDGRQHVFIYNLNTKNGLFPDKKTIQNTFRKISDSARAKDILLIFFAGHGITEGEKKQFYFLTADASKNNFSGEAAGISTLELNDWIKPANIKAQKRILIFDACNSGQAINDLVSIRNDDESRRIKSIEKLNEKSGMIILSASASNQSAYEMGKYNQGLLTYSMLKTLKQNPEILEENRFLNISRWFDAAGDLVVSLANEAAGGRQDPQVFSNSNFPLGVVDDEVRAGIVLPEEKPMFVATRLINKDESILSDDLGLGGLIDTDLNDISSRGTTADITFMSNTSSPDAYSVNGIYEIKGNEVKCRVNLRQHKQTIDSFEMSGNRAELSKISRMIAQRAVDWVMNSKKNNQ